MRGFMLEIKKETTPEDGRCEICNRKPSSRIFNIGCHQHRMCTECFDEMMRSFNLQCRLAKPPPNRNERNCDVYRDYDKAFAAWSRGGTEYGNFGEWLLAKKENLAV
jgi:hypothetical protein